MLGWGDPRGGVAAGQSWHEAWRHVGAACGRHPEGGVDSAWCVQGVGHERTWPRLSTLGDPGQTRLGESPSTLPGSLSATLEPWGSDSARVPASLTATPGLPHTGAGETGLG